MIHPDDECGAPWCNRLTELAKGNTRRQIDGVNVCGSCYQRTWKVAKKLGVSIIAVSLELVGPPNKHLIKGSKVCAREDCITETVQVTEGVNNRRRIRNLEKTKEYIVCRSCYQTAWKISKQDKCSLFEAFLKLPPKGKHRKKTHRQRVTAIQSHEPTDRLPEFEDTFDADPLPDLDLEHCPRCSKPMPRISIYVTRKPITGGDKTFYVCPNCHKEITSQSSRYDISMIEAWHSLQVA